MSRRLSALLIVLAVVSPIAQTPKPAFEVVSIRKRLEPLRPPITNVIKGSVFKMPEVNLSQLVRWAWQIRDFQLVGGPRWMWTDWFDVEARADSDTTSLEEMRLMVRSMLEARFGLSVHWERRDIPVSSLELARTDGQLGPHLRRWDDCSKRSTAPRWSFPAEGTQSSGCGTLTDVAIGLSRYMDRPAIDATGLGGTFQYGWHVPSDPEAFRVEGVVRHPRARVSEAIEKHLGVTLKDARRPFDVLVVDSLQQPTAN